MEREYEQVLALVDSERYPDAIDLASQYIVKFPDDPRFYYLRGWSYYVLRLNDQARADFEKCIEIDPEYYNGYKGMAALCETVGLHDIAEALFTKALHRAPDKQKRAVIYANLGEMYIYSKRDMKKGIRLIKKSIALHDIGDSYYALGLAYLNIDRRKKAESVWHTAIEEKEFTESKFRHLTLYMLSLQCNERKMYTQALAYIEQALQGAPHQEQYIRLRDIIKRKMDAMM